MSLPPDNASSPSEKTAFYGHSPAPGKVTGVDLGAATLVPSSTPPGPSAETLDRAAPPAGPPSLPRHPVQGYELLAVLGRGGMGVVYKARHLSLNRVVALKMVLAGEHASPESCVRFLGEAEVVAGLHHPNIVQIHEFGNHEGLPYFTLEYLEGGTLDRRLGGTPLPAKDAARTVEVLARAVHHAHRHGVVHRDLKPGNVLYDEDGTPKVTDFGLAKRVEGGSGLTQSGNVLGTPSYMAPEQASGDNKNVGPRSDVYALGAILYECLTGRPPFKAETPVDTIMQLLDHEPPSPSRLNPNCPRDLETISLKCLQKEAAKRYGSAEELADDLKRYQDGEAIRARPVPARERLARWVRKRPAAAALLAVTAASLAAFLAVGWWYNLHLKEALGDAEAQHRLADDRLQEAVAEHARFVAEAAEVERQRQIVVDNLDKRFDVIDDILNHVDGRLAQMANMRPVRVEFLNEVMKLSQQLLKDRPDDPRFRRQAGRVFRGLGELAGAGRDGEEPFRQAAEVQGRLVKDFPDDVGYKMDLTLTLSRLGTLYARSRKFDAALRAYDDALALQDPLNERFPDKPDHLERCGYYRTLKANVLEEMDESDQALAHYRQARGRLEELVKRFPKTAAYHERLAATAASLGFALEAGDPLAAQPPLVRALSATREAHRLTRSERTATALRSAYADMVAYYKRQLQHAELAKLADARREDFPKSVNETYNAACFLCDAARAAADNADLPERERQTRVDGYAKEALAKLQLAVEEGFTDLAHMANDTDLDPLRDRADYKEFWATLEKRFPSKPVTPALLMADLKDDYAGTQARYERQAEAARTVAEKKRAKANKPVFLDYARRIADIAEKNPSLPASLDALAWLLDRAGSADDRQAVRPLQARVYQLLERDHLSKKNFGNACRALGRNPSAAGDRLLRAAEEKNPESDARGLAAYYLASSLAKQADAAHERGAANADALALQAEKEFERVVTAHGAVAFDEVTLADYAKRRLHELRSLSLGRAARPVEGEDLMDGTPLKLTDHRGKVVLVTFWANWCGYCRQLYPTQRDLVAKMKGRPFELFGINCDEDKEAAKRAVQREKLPWHSLWDGDGDGRIREEWQVDGFPALYLLDHGGVIRKKWDSRPEPGEVEEEVARLVRQAEAARKP